MSELYNTVAERLWEKLEYHRGELDTRAVKLPSVFPMDDFEEKNPLFRTLVNEVESEFCYQMSEKQCSWAVVKFCFGLPFTMQEYNECNGTNLSPRA